MSAEISRLTRGATLPVERRSFPLRLWDGGPDVPTVYIATPKPDGPGYTLRRYAPETPTAAEVFLTGIRDLAAAVNA